MRRSFGKSGRSSMAELQPSKLATRVRFPSPAPRRLRQGGVMAAAADSKSAVREDVRVRVPPLAPAFAPYGATAGKPNTDEHATTGGVSEWSMVQPWKGCVGASPPGVRIPPPPPMCVLNRISSVHGRLHCARRHPSGRRSSSTTPLRSLRHPARINCPPGTGRSIATESTGTSDGGSNSTVLRT